MNESNWSGWVHKAESDWEMAKRALRGQRRLPDAACYHAQQCAEKYLKAVLTFQQIEFPRIHDLDSLNQLCLQAGVMTGFERDSLDLLTAYAVQVRYPGEEPTEAEARRAVEIARAVRAFARRWLGL
ncbi:MAG: HEPN domain-containing protein [Chloroflexota bacterium]|nr:MAG: nucleotidyltransferase [Bellilinea sp.]